MITVIRGCFSIDGGITFRPGGVPSGSVAACVGILLGMVAVGAGCAGRTQDKWTRARPATYAAGGTVLVDGKPMEGVKVQFERSSADDGPPCVAFGYTDSWGRFRLRTFRDGDGAVAGDHVVLIERITFEPMSKPARAEVAPMREVSHLPDRYRSSHTSGMTATVVPGGRNEFSFAITAK